jgi:1-acyl-sn-glycerol-3-phosphate acyltransferase
LIARTDAADNLGWRWALVVGRVALWVLVFAAIIIPHVVFTLCGRRDIIPPLFLGTLSKIAGVRARVLGQPLPGALLLGNHVSWLDILALAGVTGTAFVAHDGLSAHPFLEWLCEQNETLFITRDQRGTVSAQVAQVTERLGHRRLTIFPEATTGDGISLLPFRSSLLSAVERVSHDVPVQPFALDFAEAPDIAWVGDEPGLVNFCRIMARTRPVHLTIRFLAPLAGDELTNRKTMATAAQARVAVALGMEIRRDLA